MWNICICLRMLFAQTESSQSTPEVGAISDPNIEAYSAAAISETETLFQPLSTLLG